MWAICGFGCRAKAPYAAGTGKNVNATNQNGYILYFADHRGMQPDADVRPATGSITG